MYKLKLHKLLPSKNLKRKNLMHKLEQLKTLMAYFELVSLPGNGKDLGHRWTLRNITDEGIGQEVPFSKVCFTDVNLEDLLDRAISYAVHGPHKDIIKAALEVTAIVGKRTIIQGDVIAVMTEFDNCSEVMENKLAEMNYKYGKYELDIVYLNEHTND